MCSAGWSLRSRGWKIWQRPWPVTESKSRHFSGLDCHMKRSDGREKFLCSVLSDIEALSEQGRWKSGDSISIVAKSLGASIVERAFPIQEGGDQELQCEVFLRLAPPKASHCCFAKTTVNVSIPWDHLTLGAKIMDRLATRDSSKEGSGRILNIRLSELSHKDLNRNVVIPRGEFAGRKLYELYRKLLGGAVC